MKERASVEPTDVFRVASGFGFVSLPTSPVEIRSLVDEGFGAYRRGLPLAGKAGERDRQKLSRVLLTPAPTELWRGVNCLVVIPGAELHYFPFEALPPPDGLPPCQAPSRPAMHHRRPSLRT
jgi:hypothetical protein